jgi:hypothetical protein
MTIPAISYADLTIIQDVTAVIGYLPAASGL